MPANLKKSHGVGLKYFVDSVIVVTTALFALLYRFLPDVRLRWRDVTTGAFVTAILFTIGQQLIGLYLGQTACPPATAPPGP